jgi:glycosyltransferase involved in cell wall biosynthesis
LGNAAVSCRSNRDVTQVTAFHLAALPGQPVTKENSVCAFTQKVRKFADMMIPLGHEVVIYGDQEHSSMAEHVACYPDCDPPPFTPDAWEPFNAAAVKEIRKRAKAGDVLGLMGGLCQTSLVQAFPEMYPVEYGIGYGGCFAPYKVFESYAWMHTCYGQQRGSNAADGSFYDAVIPAYFEPEDFPENTGGGDYLLYVGRLTQRKGIEIVTETAKRLGMPLKLAGAGDWVPEYGEALGNVKPVERGELMAGAKALICPTIYVEPFGCIAVEAQLCGTPVISTDWGAFTETVRQGISGWRCRRLGEFMWAVENADTLDKAAIRQHAQATWSLEAVAPRYDHYFRHLKTLEGDGWYADSLTAPVELANG